MPKVKCEICGITTTRIDNKKRQFMAQFPLDKDRCRQWVKVTGNEDLAYVPIEKLHQLKHICGKHFKSKDFTKKKTQLRKNAVPSIGINVEPLSEEILKEFPLHMVTSAKEGDVLRIHHMDSHSQMSQEYDYSKSGVTHKSCSPNSIISQEHSYCKSGFSDRHCKSGSGVLCEPLTSIHDRAMQLNNHKLSSTDFQETVSVLRKRSSSPKPSTSSQATAGVPLKRKRSPSTASQETLSVNFTTTHSSPKPLISIKKNLLDTPRKKKLRKQLQKSKMTVKILKKKVDQIDKINSPVLKSLISAAVQNKHRKPQGKRWTQVTKSIALAIYKKSPKAYRYINQYLPMPSVRTLQTVLQKIKMEAGIYPSVITHLKKQAQVMTAKNKVCVIMFDEIALKKRLIYDVACDKVDGYVDIGAEGERTNEIADHALVFMLQGINKKFKQPIAHYFVKGTISTQRLALIIKKIIQTIRDTGYSVISTVCDQGPTNMGALNLLKRLTGNTDDSNFFLLNDEKVFIIYDVPHLFKSIRNNFLAGGTLVMGNKKAKWSHLVELEKKNKTTLHFRKITKLHVEPKFRAKMRVKLAAQILSNTTAAVLKLLSESTSNAEHSREILETAEIIEDLDRLFDCTNGPSSRKDIKKHIRENVRKNSFHHRLWIEYKSKLNDIHFTKSDSHIRLKNVRCVNGYIITLKSLQDIWQYVESKNFKYLNLRQLNQDSLENFFGIIRQHSPTNRNPTCHHFHSALKSSVITRLSTPKSRGSNCESDNNEILFDFHDIVFQKASRKEEKSGENAMSPSNEDFPVLHIEDFEETELEEQQLEELFKVFDKQPTVYVSGYLAMTILKKQKCQECCRTLKASDPEQNSVYSYIALREWWNDKSSLTYPTLQLCRTVDLSTKIFDREIRNQLFRKYISDYFVTMMMAECDITWICKDHRQLIAELLFRRLSHLLIRNECRIINSSFAEAEEKSADFTKKAQQLAVAK